MGIKQDEKDFRSKLTELKHMVVYFASRASPTIKVEKVHPNGLWDEYLWSGSPAMSMPD